MRARTCIEHGCPALVESGTRCALHHTEHVRKKSKRRGFSAHAAGYNAEWEHLRKRYLKVHPYCECDDCLALPLAQRDRSQDVDHRDGLGPDVDNGGVGNAWHNLRAMSHRHHSKRTATEQRRTSLPT